MRNATSARLTPASQLSNLKNKMRYLALFSILTVACLAQSEPRTAEEFYARAQQDMAQKQTDKVIEDCTQAILQDPDFQEALLMRATAFSSLKQYDRAVADFDAVLKLHPRSATFVSRGNQYMLLKKYDAALADFSEAIRRMPNRSAAYELRANARQKLGDTKGAADDRAKARELGGSPVPVGFTPGAMPGDPKATAQRIGAGVSAPKVLNQKQPEYTEAARQAKIQGDVVLSLIVDENGSARDFQILRPLGYGLDEMAIEAVQKWRFQPGMKDGKAVAVFATIEVNFRLL